MEYFLLIAIQYRYSAIASIDSSVTVVDSVSTNTSATGNGGFAYATGSSHLNVKGSNITHASGLLGGRF